MNKGRMVKEKKRLLWIGDAVAHTGFARVTHSILDQLYKKWDVYVLGVNYKGDPHDYSYKIYPANLRGDIYGVNRLPELLKTIQPDVVCIINDFWIVNDYMSVLKDYVVKAQEYNTKHGNEQVSIPKLCAYMPVDGLNVRQEYAPALNDLNARIAYTEFGAEEFRKAGVKGYIHVIPHGLDTKVFNPIDRSIARQALTIPQDWYIVGLVGRSQPRKRIDLAIKYFAEWVKDKPDNVKFYYHGAIKDVGIDIPQLMKYYGIDNRLMVTSTTMTSAVGIPVERLKYVYSTHDVHISTSAGEGMGLCQMESMACGIPQIVPEWSALAEWPQGAVHYVPCTSTIVHPGGINTIGGLADEHLFIEALEKMYTNEQYRMQLGRRGLELMNQPKFNWTNIADQFDQVFTKEVNT